MIAGIKFLLSNDWNTYLSKILFNIPCEAYKFFIIDEYNQVFDKKLDFLFKENIYDGGRLLKLANEDLYYTVSIVLQAYRTDVNDELYKIMNYIDFINSSCQFIIKIIDNVYVNIYSKNMDFLQVFYNNAVLFSFSNIEFIDNKTINDLFYD